MADIFIKSDVRAIFRGKKVLCLGDSILRNLYQDFIYLLEKGTFTPTSLLRKKGTQIKEGDFPGDSLVDGTCVLITGRDYTETREYHNEEHNIKVTFNFITRCYDRVLSNFLDSYQSKHGDPDVILVLSALWDINRWGPRGIEEYSHNCKKLLRKVKTVFPKWTQLIWLCSPPISVEVEGGLMVEGMEFQERSMRFNVMEGNLMVSLNSATLGYDVVDLHYWMTHQIHKRMSDGIHWAPDAVRLQLNIILTHFCLSRDLELPGRWTGTQNRPLESAKRIAEAAGSVSVDEEGPLSKRQRVEEEFIKRQREDEDDTKERKRLRIDEGYSRSLERGRFDVVVDRKVTLRRGECKVEGRVINGLELVGGKVNILGLRWMSEGVLVDVEKEVWVGPGGKVWVRGYCHQERVVLRAGDMIAQAVYCAKYN